MTSEQKLATAHTKLVAVITEAQSELQQAKEQFFAAFERARALCEQAVQVAQEWNSQSDGTYLPVEFFLDARYQIPHALHVVDSFKIATPNSVFRDRALTPADLKPVASPPRKHAA